MKTLTLGEGLALPADEAVTQKYGFIGRSGSGKSYAAMRMAELFLEHGAQIIALDWVGIWWSLRLARNGKDAGFKHVYIFGGEHADVELKPESGALMADLVVDKHISVVLDVMHFRKAERTRFATAFAEQFFHRKKTARTACHLFIEEAQAYLPQFVRGEEARMVGVFEDIGKVGRNYGIGNSLISQRPQAINKDVLNQVEVLLAFQTNGPQERKTIAGWTAENTTAGAAMIQQLPALHVGHALVWSPQWLRLAAPVHISERITYDASSTPTQQAKSIAPKVLAKADLEQLGAEMNAIVERAKAEDPRTLKAQLAAKDKRISELEKASAGSAHLKAGKPTPVLTDADRALLKDLADELRGADTSVFETLEAAVKMLSEKIQEEGRLATEWLGKVAALNGKRVTDSLDRARLQKIIAKLEQVSAPTAQHIPAPKSVTALCPPRAVRQHNESTRHQSVEGITPSKQRILNALAFFEAIGLAKVDKVQLALMADASPNSGAYNNNLGALRTAGLISYPTPGDVALTDAGAAIADAGGSIATTEGLQHAIRSKLPPAKWRIVAALIAAYPDALPKDQLAERAQASPGSGAFNNNLGSLRSLGLITYPQPGHAQACPVLFLEGR